MTGPGFRFSGPVISSSNPARLAHFYERLLAWTIAESEGPTPDNGGWALLRSPDGKQKIEIQWEPHYVAPTWPSVSGEQLMMLHLDFGVGDLAEGVGWAKDVGAITAEYQPHDHVTVLLDPEGHPFCLFQDNR